MLFGCFNTRTPVSVHYRHGACGLCSLQNSLERGGTHVGSLFALASISIDDHSCMLCLEGAYAPFSPALNVPYINPRHHPLHSPKRHILPSLLHRSCGSMAERLTTNQEVAGSTPAKISIFAACMGRYDSRRPPAWFRFWSFCRHC
ncbi:hypothetical protein BR93DRAFT_492278 [Coniochaeta sp. PMI_546]|nr:hypothetical protein BR93DRAFT_492278 [Coniochaeta sp. PMI_546]